MRTDCLACCFILAVAIPTASIAQQSGPSLWDHNGSTVYLVANGQAREFYYQEPRQGMADVGARQGSLLFSGASSGGRYWGTAYIYRGACGKFPYQVTGPILDNYERVVLKGQAPRVGADCRVRGYFEDTLEFSLLKPGGGSVVSSRGSIPAGFVGIWIEAGTSSNACMAKEYETRGEKYEWDYFTRLVKVTPRSLEAWELGCKLEAAREEVSSQDRTSVELAFACGEGALSWKVQQLWSLQTIDDRKNLTMTSLRYSDWRDESGRRVQQETPRKQTTTYLECK